MSQNGTKRRPGPIYMLAGASLEPGSTLDFLWVVRLEPGVP